VDRASTTAIPISNTGIIPAGGITTSNPTMGTTENRHTIRITGIERIPVTTVIICIKPRWAQSARFNEILFACLCFPSPRRASAITHRLDSKWCKFFLRLERDETEGRGKGVRAKYWVVVQFGIDALSNEHILRIETPRMKFKVRDLGVILCLLLFIGGIAAVVPAQTRPIPTPRPPHPFPCPPRCDGTPIQTTPAPNL
jgi:hypothetical protein